MKPVWLVGLVALFLVASPLGHAEAQAPIGSETPPEDPKAPNDFNPGDHGTSTTGDDFRVDSSDDGTIGAEVNQPGSGGVRGPV